MTYTTMLVHLDLETPHANLLDATMDLATRFGARVIGVGVCQPLQRVYVDGYVPPEVVEQDRLDKDNELRCAGEQFHSRACAHGISHEWRANVTIDALGDHVAKQARVADLVIMKRTVHRSTLDMTGGTNIGDVIMRAGRPVLIVPPAVTRIELGHMVVGWKDTREARRAIVDALPLLRSAGKVTVVTIAPKDEWELAQEGLLDVTNWLRSHRVSANSKAVMEGGNDAETLTGFLREEKADLLVAGAYGHNRLREWIFGGVTNDLLLSSELCVLLSH